MTRNGVLFTTILCLLFICSMTTKASVEGYENGFFYSIKNGTAEIIGIDNTIISSRIIIPSTIAGKKVTAIGNQIFSNSNCANKITSVTIPDTVTTIGYEVFRGCKKLKEVKLSKNLRRIGESAFGGCSSLKEIAIPAGVESLEASVFGGCINLEKITLPKNPTKIGAYCFSNCEKLKSIIIPYGVKTIGEDAFSFCYNLEKISIPNSVVKIDKWAFNECRKLKEIRLPDSVRTLGKEMFIGCKNLAKATISKGMKKIPGSTFWECVNLTEVKIPENVEEIGHDAFGGCKKLKKISFPKSMKIIGKDAFMRCNALKTVIIPKTIKKISNKALGFTWTRIGEDDMSPIRKIPGFTIISSPDTAAKKYAREKGFAFYLLTSSKTVGYGAPASKKITSIKIPKSIKVGSKTYKVTSIGKKAFVGCWKLNKATIPASVKKIGGYSFYGCLKLKTIRIYTKKLTKNNVGKGVFKDISKKAVFYVPSAKKKAYRQIFLKRGAKKTMKFENN